MFKESFKYYKANQPLPVYDEVIDCYKAAKYDTRIKIVNIYDKRDITETPKKYGLIPVEEWQVYEFIEHDGLIFIKNPFTRFSELYWSFQCTHNYPKIPNKCNIDNVLFNDDLVNNVDEFGDFLKKIRWVTFGFHHNWDTKLYSNEERSEFPNDLKRLTEYVAKILGFSEFKAEAAIVNYYPLKSTLSGHTDHSEQNLDAPLLSFSFGQTAIFLLGGLTKDTKPTPIFLRNGDILVMSKKSRLCYHGVPRIIQENNYAQFGDIDREKILNDVDFENMYFNQELRKQLQEYLENHRININVRQVL